VADALRRRAAYDGSPRFVRASDGQRLTAAEMAAEVDAGTPAGLAFIDDVIGAAVRIIAVRDSEKPGGGGDALW